MIDWQKWADYADGSRDISRRDGLKLIAATALGVDTVDDGDNMYTRAAGAAGWAGEQTPDIKWQLGPFGDVDKKNEVDRDKVNNTETETDTGTPTPVDTPTATEEPENAWVENYDVDSFVEDLYDQDEDSIGATNDFLGTAYDMADGEINEVGITEDNYLKVNDISASLYDDNPGLSYTEEFGETLKVLDNEDELEDVVEGYVQQELV